MRWLPLLVVCVALVAMHWCMRRAQRRDQRRLELRLQLLELERQIREEALPEEERARLAAYRAEQAEVKREARRRLGLPEDAEP
jgi:hypothetical protein